MSALLKICPRCGSTFECMHDHIAKCQCAGVKLTESQRKYIREHYTDCLCRKCLEEIAAHHE